MNLRRGKIFNKWILKQKRNEKMKLCCLESRDLFWITPDTMAAELGTFIIDEENSFDSPSQTFREQPRHQSNTDFTEWNKKRAEEAKENAFEAQIKLVLDSFCKQYVREYIKLKIKDSVYDTIDKELNRESFSSFPHYYHLRTNDDRNRQQSPAPRIQTSDFQPVYSLRYLLAHRPTCVVSTACRRTLRCLSDRQFQSLCP